MDLPTLAPLVAAAASAGAVIAAVIRAAFRFSRRVAVLELKVETMWQFQCRRGQAEAVATGIATMNSPLRVDPHPILALGPIREQLVAFYDALPRPLGDSEAMLRLEARFGDELVRRLCVPFKLNQGACLLVALAVAKQSDQVDFPMVA